MIGFSCTTSKVTTMAHTVHGDLFASLFSSRRSLPRPVEEAVDDLRKTIANHHIVIDVSLPPPHRSDRHGLSQKFVRSEPILSREPGNSVIYSLEGIRSTLSDIEVALAKASAAHSDALAQSGMNPSVLELLQSFVETQVEARISLQRELDRVVWIEQSLQEKERAQLAPVEPLTATELAQRLNVGPETIRRREREGELFSILRPGRQRGREYPAFQAWPGIAGQPLKAAMAPLRDLGGPSIYGFFTSPIDLLGGLTPIEALCGELTSQRELDQDALDFLGNQPAVRLAAVVRAAEAFAADAAA